MKARKVLNFLFLPILALMYLWIGVMAWTQHREHQGLHARIRIQGSIIRTQDHVIDSLQSLLHIQVVGMEGFRTLCYIKTPVKAEPDGDADAG